MISVIIPTHNRRGYLEKAISSILNQKKVKIEIIVVDDASTDDTEAYIRSLQQSKIIYIKNEMSLFVQGTRKKGYPYATGKYIIFMDDDDFYIDEYFFSQAEEVMEKNDNISAVIGSTIGYRDGKYTSIIDLGGDGFISNISYINEFGKTYLKPQSTLSAIFRKTELDEFGFPNFRMINDTCIYLAGILKNDVYLINKPVAAYRLHSGNISNSKFSIAFIRDCLEAKKEIFAIAESNQSLEFPYSWYGNQICQSAFYFMSSSGKNPKICIWILYWVLFKSNGAGKYFFRTLISQIRK